MKQINSYDISILSTEAEIEQGDLVWLKQELYKTRALCSALSEVIDEIPDTIYVTDGDARTMLVNKAYEKLSGVSRAEILGVNMRDIQKRYISKSGSLVALETGKQSDIELTFKRTKRQAFISSKPVFDEAGNIKMVVSNSRNFEEIEKLEKRLVQTEELADRYRAEIRAMKEHFLPHHDIIAEDKNMRDVLVKANKVAQVDTTTLILGETGSGKEEVAKFIHENCTRAKNRFVKVNCGALTESLIESELFGYEKGAFTGANKSGKMGLFEVADQGMLFLDEIGELPLEMQVKLLRVLQDQQVTRIGGTKPIDIDVRILAATNRDLKEMIAQKRFREDLYYRLNVVPIYIPPLRERPLDIIPLANRFLENLNHKYHFHKTLSKLAYQRLKEHRWPGNVRELKNVIEQAVIMSEGDQINVSDLPFTNEERTVLIQNKDQIDLKSLLEKMEYDYMTQAYEQHKSVRNAAKSLHMNYSTFERKRKQYEKKFIVT